MPKPLPDELAWRLLETMLVIRRFEENVLRMSAEKHFGGHYHLYIGQEATGAAVMSVLEPRDRLNTTHRNHGHVLARGRGPAGGLLGDVVHAHLQVRDRVGDLREDRMRIEQADEVRRLVRFQLRWHLRQRANDDGH